MNGIITIFPAGWLRESKETRFACPRMAMPQCCLRKRKAGKRSAIRPADGRISLVGRNFSRRHPLLLVREKPVDDVHRYACLEKGARHLASVAQTETERLSHLGW